VDGFGVVVLVIFGIIAAAAKAAKTAQGTGAPGVRRLPPRPPGGILGSPPADLLRQAGVPTPQQRAETLVPDDLWALLTGQQRQAPPAPQRSSFEVSPARSRAQLEAGEEQSYETAVAPAAAAPAVVPAAPAAQPPASAPAVVTAVATTHAATALGSLRQRGDLRRAMMLQVILGPPKALE
jgi:hypothetical protein